MDSALCNPCILRLLFFLFFLLLSCLLGFSWDFVSSPSTISSFSTRMGKMTWIGSAEMYIYFYTTLPVLLHCYRLIWLILYLFYIAKLEVVFVLQKYYGHLPFKKNWGCLKVTKKLRWSFIKTIIEVIFHISSSWLKIRLHAKNQLLMLPRIKIRLSSNWKNKVVFYLNFF